MHYTNCTVSCFSYSLNRFPSHRTSHRCGTDPIVWEIFRVRFGRSPRCCVLLVCQQEPDIKLPPCFSVEEMTRQSRRCWSIDVGRP